MRLAGILSVAVATMALLAMAGCATQAEGSRGSAPQTVAPESVDVGFLPGQVIATIPIYPGAEGSAELQPGSGPPSFPGEIPICVGPRCPELQTASRQFSVDSPKDQVLSWYQEELTAMGYQRSGAGFGNQPQGGQKSHLSFFSPEQPTATVQVHTYTGPQGADAPTVFEILATYLVPLPRPEEAYLPPDITQAEVTYVSGGEQSTSSTRMVNDQSIIQSLVRIVNRMPVLADWAFMCPRRTGSEPSATLNFESPEGAWTVREIQGCPAHVEFGPYPELEDAHNLLWGTVQEMFGVGQPGTDDSPLPVEGVVPTPRPTATSTPTPAGTEAP